MKTETMIFINEDDVTIKTICPICGHTSQVTIPAEDYLKWQFGELIQNAMPYLSPESREFLISGMCRDCQDKIFG